MTERCEGVQPKPRTKSRVRQHTFSSPFLIPLSTSMSPSTRRPPLATIAACTAVVALTAVAAHGLSQLQLSLRPEVQNVLASKPIGNAECRQQVSDLCLIYYCLGSLLRSLWAQSRRQTVITKISRTLTKTSSTTCTAS